MGKRQDINEKLKNFEGYFGPVSVPDDVMYNEMAAVANVVYTDGKLDFEMFKETINNFVKISPKCWRKGQAVFNIVDYIFGVAREVQFGCGVDCFYNDDVIDDFIAKSYEQYWEHIKMGDFPNEQMAAY